MEQFLGVIMSIIVFGSMSFARNPRTYFSNDFYVKTVLSDSSIQSPLTAGEPKEAISCRERIKSILCIVEPIKPETAEITRECGAGSEDYAHYFEALYDAYPPVLQKMFCSLKVINIEKQFFGTAYAGLVKDKNGKILGAEMGIRKSVLDENLSLEVWATWKDQLSFGGSTDSYASTPGLPAVKTSTPFNGVSDFLYFVVAHEFGHMLDFSNHLNRMTNCSDETWREINPPECQMHEDGWGGISWLTDRKPKAENEFVNRVDLCFYSCEGKTIDPLSATQIYTDLHNSNFISLYSSIQPWDDFADSLAYFMMNRHLFSPYLIEVSKGRQFDIMTKLRSPIWSKKYDYLDRLVNRTDLIYP